MAATTSVSPPKDDNMADAVAAPTSPASPNDSTDQPPLASSPSPTSNPDESLATAHVVSLRLLFTAWITHFRSLGYVKDSTMDLLDKTVLKKTVELTVRDSKARVAIGTSDRVWSDIVDLFHVAIPSLEGRTYVMPPAVASTAYDANGLPYDTAPGTTAVPPPNLYDGAASGPSSNMMVANSATLLRDLQRLDSILALARNVLTAGEQCQNLAAQVGFDREVCAMVNLCVKITARGFDGDSTTTQDEEKWNAVVNGFKKLLITSLQFLSNLVTMNERLKLMLWVELFDNNSENGGGNGTVDAATEGRTFAENWVTTAANAFMNQPSPVPRDAPMAAPAEEAPLQDFREDVTADGRDVNYVLPYHLYLHENKGTIRAELSAEAEPTIKELVQEGVRRWNAMSQLQKQEWNDLYAEKFKTFKTEFDAWEVAALQVPMGDAVQRIARSKVILMARADESGEQIMNGDVDGYDTPRPTSVPKHVASQANLESFPSISHGQPDYRMIESAADGAKKLAEGKSQLLKRLQSANMAVAHPQPLMSPASPIEVPASPVGEEPEILGGEEEEEEDEEGEEGEEDEEEDEEGEEESEEEDSSDDDDYAVPGEDGRGLLTDVPLILGPNEIEVLPMIIMSGIVPPTPDANKAQGDDAALSEGAVNMYTIRCHLLLAQENGRNLLRELLIFVAAWDLREEELYFKFMVKIMEAILMNGLMPFAYNAFKESKDIISPAQAVIMKLLTKIFHSRQAFVNAPNTLTVPPRHTPRPTQPPNATSTNTNTTPAFPTAPLRFDIQIVHFLFSEFRQNIIPQICALIFLQGQIRAGCANLEDFPLNLWDMERMYEGVYQYLEFFAILTDHESWKVLMAEWEVAYELVTLLRELEVAIPKGGLVRVGSVPEPLIVGRAQGRAADIGQQQQQQPQQPQQQQQQQHYPPPQVADRQQTHQQHHDGQTQPPAPLAVERPYDVASPPLSHAPHTNTALPPLDPTIPPPHTTAPLPSPSPEPATYPSPLHDEPADFEWRNLKKLCVLVLSSLVWKNTLLQDQVRAFDGIPAILSCCSYDEHNPYIREHAIMCLRFLLEGNRANMDVVRGFAERDGSGGVRGVVGEAVVGGMGERGAAGVETRGQAAPEVQAAGGLREPAPVMQNGVQVPPEVLDTRGYETYMDHKGKVGLRRKEHPVSSYPPPPMSAPIPGHVSNSFDADTERRNYGMAASMQQADELVNGRRRSRSVDYVSRHGEEEEAEFEGAEEYDEGEEEADEEFEREEDARRQGSEPWSKGLPSWVQMVVGSKNGAGGAGGGTRSE